MLRDPQVQELLNSTANSYVTERDEAPVCRLEGFEADVLLPERQNGSKASYDSDETEMTIEVIQVRAKSGWNVQGLAWSCDVVGLLWRRGLMGGTRIP